MAEWPPRFGSRKLHALSCVGALALILPAPSQGLVQHSSLQLPHPQQILHKFGRSSASWQGTQAPLLGEPVENHAVQRIRGGGGLAKKLGPKNMGLALIFLSLLYVPRAMASCNARLTGGGKIQRLGCGAGLMITNIATICGLGLVLMNSRQFDRHGRSKFKMRLNGTLIMVFGMLLIITHAEAAKLSFYSSFNTQLGLILEWWGFVSLFYNFTPRFVAQVPRELRNVMRKLMAKMGFGSEKSASKVDNETRQRELERLNQWAQVQPPP